MVGLRRGNVTWASVFLTKLSTKRMYFPDVNAQLILLIQCFIHVLWNFKYCQAILFKQIPVVAVIDSKLKSVKKTNQGCSGLQKPLWQVPQTTKARCDFLTFFKFTLRERNKNPIVLSLKVTCSIQIHNASNAQRLHVKYSLVIAAFCVKGGNVNELAIAAPSITDSSSDKFLK